MVGVGCHESPGPDDVDPGSVQPTQTQMNSVSMNWLITTKRGIDLAQLDAVIAKYGFRRLDDRKVVPLGSDEQSIEITGPAEGSRKLTGEAIILGVYPNSGLTLDK